MSRTIVVLGCTGRLGPAVMRAFSGWHLRGLSRRDPLPHERVEGAHYLRGDRRDVALLRRICAGAELIFDGLAMVQEDAEALLVALDGLSEAPRHLIFASSVAEQGRAAGADETTPCLPDAHDGKGKLAVRRLYERGFRGKVHGLILPRLVAEVDLGRRELPYLEAAVEGSVLLPSAPDVRQVIAPVEGVAAVVRALADAPERLPTGRLNVGPPAAVEVGRCVEALLQGARLEATLAPHPDPSWRGPHGGGPEPLDTGLLQRLWPALVWPDPIEVYRQLGAWLVANPDERRRPVPLVRPQHKQWEGRDLIDMHGARERPLVREPIASVSALARWLSPAFYVDIGRPCNSACIYCAVPPHLDSRGFTPLAELRRQIDRGVRSGAWRAILVGGEPSIYPELDGLLVALKESALRGPHVIMTNGLRLAKPGMIEGLLRGGVEVFHLSIDTVDPAIYARLSRSSGRLSDQQVALERLLSYAQSKVYIYTAVTRENAPGLPDLLRWLAALCDRLGLPPIPVIFAFIKPVGDALVHADRLLFTPGARARVAREAVELADALGIPLALRSIQACLVPELVPRLFDYYVDDHSIDLATGARQTFTHNVSYMTHLELCEGCAHRGCCTGIYRRELESREIDGYRALSPGESGLADSALSPPGSKPR